eukprot:jgi/Botrbrau1/18536/Bobra.0596s0003.1
MLRECWRTDCRRTICTCARSEHSSRGEAVHAARQGRDARLPLRGHARRAHPHHRAGDGCISLYDLRSKSQEPAVQIWQGGSAVSCLSWEEPWLAATLLDGSLLLLDLEAGVRAPSRVGHAPPVHRPRQFPGQGGSAYCVQLSDQWMACGSEEMSVRTWNFSVSEGQQRKSTASTRRQAAGRSRGSRLQDIPLRAAWEGPGGTFPSPLHVEPADTQPSLTCAGTRHGDDEEGSNPWTARLSRSVPANISSFLQGPWTGSRAPEDFDSESWTSQAVKGNPVGFLPPCGSQGPILGGLLGEPASARIPPETPLSTVTGAPLQEAAAQVVPLGGSPEGIPVTPARSRLPSQEVLCCLLAWCALPQALAPLGDHWTNAAERLRLVPLPCTLGRSYDRGRWAEALALHLTPRLILAKPSRSCPELKSRFS